MVVTIGGFSESTMFFVAFESLVFESRRQYMYARSRTSGLSFSAVDACSTLCTRPCAFSGRFKKSLTTAVKICNWVWSISATATAREWEEQTWENSSLNPSTKPPRMSPALLIFSAYSPTIQMRAALAFGSSSSSMHLQSVGIMPS